MNIVLEIERCAKVENKYRDRENPMYVLPTEREKKESFILFIYLLLIPLYLYHLLYFWTLEKTFKQRYAVSSTIFWNQHFLIIVIDKSIGVEMI